MPNIDDLIKLLMLIPVAILKMDEFRALLEQAIAVYNQHDQVKLQEVYAILQVENDLAFEELMGRLNGME
jgi:hypothetical protein